MYWSASSTPTIPHEELIHSTSFISASYAMVIRPPS
jgi:hypothetical protein